MAENNNSRKSEGLCQKMHKAVCPLGSRIRRISTSTTNDQKQIMHQSSLSKMIPVEYNHISPEKTKKSAPKSNHAWFAKATTKKDDETVHDDHKFSDYIKKVKNRMMKTASSIGVGGGGGGRISPRRDSFNDKVTDYIDHAKMKIRTTTNVGVEKSISLK